jgi:hypothetical protein
MEDPAEQLIRRALGRRPPPKLRPTLADEVLRRVASRQPPAVPGVPAARWRLAVPWVAAAAASAALLAQLEWSSAARALAWGLALAMVPLTYSVALWPGRTLGFLVLWASPLLGEPREAPVSSATPGPRERG